MLTVFIILVESRTLRSADSLFYQISVKCGVKVGYYLKWGNFWVSWSKKLLKPKIQITITRLRLSKFLICTLSTTFCGLNSLCLHIIWKPQRILCLKFLIGKIIFLCFLKSSTFFLIFFATTTAVYHTLYCFQLPFIWDKKTFWKEILFFFATEVFINTFFLPDINFIKTFEEQLLP